MRWPIARNRGSSPTSSTASVQAAGAEVRLRPTRASGVPDAVFSLSRSRAGLELHVTGGNEE